MSPVHDLGRLLQPATVAFYEPMYGLALYTNVLTLYYPAWWA